ncbi:MAG: hypothetical protein SXQ77_07545 [Halobacteria archaeon]|nr:hypothetical protein [Halobacteria archaeon]
MNILENSKTVNEIRRFKHVFGDAWIARKLRDFELDNLLNVIRASSFVSLLLSLTSSISVESSKTVSELRKLEFTLEDSWLYGWLTAEPEPEVVVIDLRDTLSVAPFLELLDRTVSVFVPARLSSFIYRTTLGLIRDLWDSVRTSRVFEYASGLFESVEPWVNSWVVPLLTPPDPSGEPEEDVDSDEPD